MEIIIALGGGLCVAAAVLVLAIVAVRMRSSAAVAETVALSKELALAPVAGSDPTFYQGGTERPYALAHVFVREAIGGANARRGGDWRLRIAVAVNTNLDASVYRASASALQAAVSGDFDSDFQSRNPAKIGAGGRAALTNFARRHGHLSLSDRKQLSKLLGGAAVLREAPAAILHDEPGLGQSETEVRGLVDELTAVARVVESGT